MDVDVEDVEDMDVDVEDVEDIMDHTPVEETNFSKFSEQISKVALPSEPEKIPEYLEDLSVIDGKLIPELIVPDWRQELEFAKSRIEPCDLSNHLIKVTQRRWFKARVDQLLLSVRLRIVQRFYDRASRRFKDKLDEELVLADVLVDLNAWRQEQGKTVAWRLAERIDDEVQKAYHAQQEAIRYVETQSEFRNHDAVSFYRIFARRAVFFPVFYLYLASVFTLTFNWITTLDTTFSRTPIIAQLVDFLLGIGLNRVLVVSLAIFGAIWLANLWRYAKTVARIQSKVKSFNKEYVKQKATIKWAVAEHTRLSQQQPYIEPLLEVLARGYRVQMQSNVGTKASVTTDLDVSRLPACVTLARAVDTDDERMMQLRVLALRYLLNPGWRTSGLEAIAKYYAENNLLGSNNLSLSKLDTDSTVGANNSRSLLLKAFSDTQLHDRVSLERLRSTIMRLHGEVIVNWASEFRPEVQNQRNDGFDRSAFATSWLRDETTSEDWVEFLIEILGETTSFNQFNIEDKSSDLNKAERISSIAVVPNYFQLDPKEISSRVSIEKSPLKEVTPIDVVVRVDVSPWAPPEAFSVFADGAITKDPNADKDLGDEGGFTTSD